MDLWIRSQDGEDLWKVNAITIQDYAKTKAVTIVVSSGVEQIKHFATYKTKEKALKVLDEIQDSMYDIYETTGRDGNVLVRHIQPKQDNFIVYQMPADDTPPTR